MKCQPIGRDAIFIAPLQDAVNLRLIRYDRRVPASLHRENQCRDTCPCLERHLTLAEHAVQISEQPIAGAPRDQPALLVGVQRRRAQQQGLEIHDCRSGPLSTSRS